MKNPLVRVLVVVVAGCSLLVSVAVAQTSSGTIGGRVLDATSQAVPGASVTLTNRDTGETRNFTTDHTGEFLFASIQPGIYDLSVKAQGFKHYEKTGLSLSASERLSAGDLKLEIGTVSESVEVRASIGQVQTVSSERSALLDSTQVANLMSRGRDVMQLLVILPGVVNDSEGSDALGQFSAPSAVSGTRAAFSGMNIDGISGNTIRGGTLETPLNMDAISEVKVLQNTYQAEYGKGAGGIMNIVSKTGTREFHGTVYDYVRNEAFNANSWINKKTIEVDPSGATHTVPRQQYRFNTFGYNVGGPIYWPGRFNVNRDKLFFFFSQEILRNRRPNALREYTVPTAPERQGDFSQSIDLTTLQPIFVKDPTKSGSCSATNKTACFPGNLIPPGQIDPNMQKLMSIFPQPNAIGKGFNLVLSDSEDRPVRQEILRIDYNISSRLKAWFRGMNMANHDRGLASTTDKFGWGINIGPMDYATTGPNIGGNLTWIIGPTLINEFTLGWASWTEVQHIDASVLAKLEKSTYGIALSQFHAAANPLNLVPATSFGGNRATTAYDARFPMQDNTADWSLSDGITKIWNQHQFKAGVQAERAIYNQLHTGSGNFAGTFNFGTGNSNPGDTGNPYANMLLGDFRQYTEASARNDYSPITRILEWYLQDTWKVHPRLTLDLGVRFTAGLPQIPSNHLASTFVPSLFNPANAPRLYTPIKLPNGQNVTADPKCPTDPQCQVPSTLKGFIVPGSGDPLNGIVLSGTPGYSVGLVDFQGILPAPRIGFAWAVTGDGKTAVRGGFGENFSPRNDAGILGDLHSNPPLITNPDEINGNTATFLNVSKEFVSPSNFSHVLGRKNVPPRAYHTSLGIQREIRFATIVDVAYVGSFSRHIGLRRDINQVPYLSRFSHLDPTASNGTTFLADNFFRFYPGYGSIPFETFDGNSSYHSLQTQVTRRFAHGLQFGVVWTWSKAMAYTKGDQGSVGVGISPKVWNYGLADYDRTHVVTIHYLINLPRASRFLDRSFIKAVFDNWQISGITRFQSGAPMYWGNTTSGAEGTKNGDSNKGLGTSNLTNTPTGVSNDLTGGGNGWRPLVIGNPTLPKDQRTADRYFNTAAFALPCTTPGSLSCIGDAGPVVTRGPGINNWDLSLFKNIRFTERMNLQFRAEAYNAFNHTQFSDVDTNPTFDMRSGAQVNNLFGAVIAARDPRIMQLALRLMF